MRALLVEDDPAYAFLLQEMVADCATLQVEMIHAEALSEALAVLQRTAVDVLLLDLSLPDATGTEIVARVSAAWPALPIVVLTGLDDELTALRAMQAGAQDYLVKGKVDGALLGRAVRYAQERKRQEAHARQLVREQAARLAAEASERRSRIIAEASRLLAASQDCEATLPEVALLTLPVLADRCWIDLVKPGGEVRRVVVTPRGFAPEAVSIEDDPIRRVLRTGEPLVLTEVPPDMRAALGEAAPRSLLSVPVVGRGEPLGALTFLITEEGRVYQDGDLAFAGELAGRVALAMDNERLHQEARVALQRKDELVRELKRSNEELEQFAYVASHDLQEPLRMVASYTQLLARRYQGKLDDTADEFIRFAVEGVQRMKRLIEDRLAYSRVGTRSYAQSPTSCEAILERVRANLALAIEETAAEITAGPLPVVLGSESHLEQLFQNLIDNALKFRGEQPPRIHISAERQGAQHLFRVRDNGIGIDPEYFERIFVIFQRLHTRGDYPGTGIGLATARKIVERHGGRIWVESCPGGGSTFAFTLPAAQAPHQR